MQNNIVTIDLNKERGEIVGDISIIPIADVHRGDRHCDWKKLKAVVDIILSDENTYTILNGDLINNAIANSKSDIYSESMSIQDEINDIVGLFKPLADAGKILLICGGNHEDRTYKQTGISITETIAERLGIIDRYVDGLWYMFLTFGNSVKQRPITYTIAGLHGSGGGGTKGSKINKVVKLSQITQADLYIMSHVHDAIATPGVIFTPDYQHHTLVKREMHYLITNSFLDYLDSYGAKLGLIPGSTEPVKAELSSTKKLVKTII